MIIADSLNIGYKDKVVVHDLSFSLDKGMFIALIGANGAGKSTLINSLIGVIPPVSGQISWKLKTDRVNPFNDVGFSPQSQLIDWYTSVSDNVYQGPLLAELYNFMCKDEQFLKLNS
ncbi:MAG: ATP-binding cassette domain-containing protein, partial [Lactobacillus delbrueckii]